MTDIATLLAHDLEVSTDTITRLTNDLSALHGYPNNDRILYQTNPDTNALEYTPKARRWIWNQILSERYMSAARWCPTCKAYNCAHTQYTSGPTHMGGPK